MVYFFTPIKSTGPKLNFEPPWDPEGSVLDPQGDPQSEPPLKILSQSTLNFIRIRPFKQFWWLNYNKTMSNFLLYSAGPGLNFEHFLLYHFNSTRPELNFGPP